MHKSFSWILVRKLPSSLVAISCSCKLTGSCCILIDLTTGFRSHWNSCWDDFWTGWKIQFPHFWSVQIWEYLLGHWLAPILATKLLNNQNISKLLFPKCSLHSTSYLWKAVNYSLLKHPLHVEGIHLACFFFSKISAMDCSLSSQKRSESLEHLTFCKRKMGNILKFNNNFKHLTIRKISETLWGTKYFCGHSPFH